MKKFKGPPKRRSNKNKIRAKKKDPIFVDGERPRPMYVDYKDLDLLTKLTNRQGKIVGRRKSGCTAASQHAVTLAVKFDCQSHGMLAGGRTAALAPPDDLALAVGQLAQQIEILV